MRTKWWSDGSFENRRFFISSKMEKRASIWRMSVRNECSIFCLVCEGKTHSEKFASHSLSPAFKNTYWTYVSCTLKSVFLGLLESNFFLIFRIVVCEWDCCLNKGMKFEYKRIAGTTWKNIGRETAWALCVVVQNERFQIELPHNDNSCGSSFIFLWFTLFLGTKCNMTHKEETVHRCLSSNSKRKRHSNAEHKVLWNVFRLKWPGPAQAQPNQLILMNRIKMKWISIGREKKTESSKEEEKEEWEEKTTSLER